MERRKFIKQAAGLGLAVFPLVRAWSKPWISRVGSGGDGAGPVGSGIEGAGSIGGVTEPGPEWKLTGPKQPVFVYNNWSAYDELSDKVVQTEALAMQELKEILRLRQRGVRMDYYVMDAFWFDKYGGYRTWHKKHWPKGPDKWLKACRDNHLLPGMWFSSNLIATHDGRFLEPVPEWQDSVGTDPNILCLFEGGYLKHLAGTLQLWYDKGVRLFKFDFAYFEAVTAASKDKFTPEEIREKNKVAFMGMLQDFRARNPAVLITGYNGFGGDMENTFTPFRKTVDPRWLDTFDTLYCGDPRFSDVPMINIWRSQDNYSDHMTRQFEFNGLPVRRIDNCAFMIGTTGTCYYRGVHAWKGMLLLELARGGWMNVYHGNLELLTDADAAWFARAQGLYLACQQQDHCSSFGTIPGAGQFYGFRGKSTHGVVYTVVNVSRGHWSVGLPGFPEENGVPAKARILYADGGFTPVMQENNLFLGPEQLAVVGTGEYAGPSYDLGRDETIRIPVRTEKLDMPSVSNDKNSIISTITPAAMQEGWDIRIFLQQFGTDGNPVRSWGGSPPDGKKMNELIRIRARQGDRELPLHIEYDKMIWSGLSWGAAELRQGDFDPKQPVVIEGHSGEKGALQLVLTLYQVKWE